MTAAGVHWSAVSEVAVDNQACASAVKQKPSLEALRRYKCLLSRYSGCMHTFRICVSLVFRSELQGGFFLFSGWFVPILLES